MTEAATSAPESAAPAPDAGAAEGSPVVMAGDTEFSDYSPEQALQSLLEKRKKPESSAERAAEPAATADTQSPVEGDAAPEGTTVEGKETEPEIPAIDPPKSWSKDAHERWSKLDRETQEFLVARDSEDQKAIKRNLNEAATARKAAEAERAQAEQARSEHEQKARAALDILAREQQREFADIKTAQDVSNMAKTDPLRFVQWQAHQAELAAVKDAVDVADKAKADKESEDWKKFRADEDAKAIEHIPDLGDKEKAGKLMGKAVALLQDIGFTPAELGRLDKGEKLSLFDHRIQRVLVDAIRYQDVQQAKVAALKKAVPQVERPGTSATNRGAQDTQALRNKLNGSGDVNDAFALYLAKRSRRA